MKSAAARFEFSDTVRVTADAKVQRWGAGRTRSDRARS
jgi:hypothetical protein